MTAPEQAAFISNAYALFHGLHINSFFPNSTNCFSDLTNITFDYKPAYETYMSTTLDNGILKTMKTTQYIKNITKAAINCESVLINIYLYVNN